MADIPHIIASHGCAKVASERNFFQVPEGITIVYFNNHGVLSSGDKNIPFIKNLYHYQRDLYDYIVNPSNYNINLDKSNPKSYRHPDFFHSLPFYSKFNYICNMELYPPGTSCPKILLSFTNHVDRGSSYFEGVSRLDNINYTKFGEPLTFKEEPYKPYDDVRVMLRGEESAGIQYINTDQFLDLLKRKKEINNGVFFVSACRVDVFTNRESGNIEMLSIEPVERNCRDIDYDISYIEQKELQNPTSVESLTTTKNRFNFYNDRRITSQQQILETYGDSGIFYNNSLYSFEPPYSKLHDYLTNIDMRNIFVNFKSINIEEHHPIGILLDKITKLRSALVHVHERNPENSNIKLYIFLKYLESVLVLYFEKYERYPDINEFLIMVDIITSTVPEDWDSFKKKFRANLELLNQSLEQHFNIAFPRKRQKIKRKYKINYSKID